METRPGPFTQGDPRMPLRIMTIYGTRPEAIKVAPIIKAIGADPGLENIIVVTGQHREMLDQVNTMFNIVPDHDLNIMSADQTLNLVLARVTRRR
jgi:UDP-N-acetylglucosamine 2-epimerase (non-hydrolysing)